MRLPHLHYERLDERQKAAHARHAQRRDISNGAIGGPYGVWLHSPDLMDKVSALATYLRMDCALPERLRELGILIVSRFWSASYAWNAHVDKTIACGVSADAVRQLANGEAPAFEQEDERVYYQFATELLRDHFVTQATYARARGLFGEREIVDLIGSIGYWSMLSLALNAAEVDLRPGAEHPFPEMRAKNGENGSAA